jgi:hypothetical protein
MCNIDSRLAKIKRRVFSNVFLPIKKKHSLLTELFRLDNPVDVFV